MWYLWTRVLKGVWFAKQAHIVYIESNLKIFIYCNISFWLNFFIIHNLSLLPGDRRKFYSYCSIRKCMNERTIYIWIIKSYSKSFSCISSSPRCSKCWKGNWTHPVRLKYQILNLLFLFLLSWNCMALKLVLSINFLSCSFPISNGLDSLGI